MKNSAETSQRPALFQINEHRLAVGLLGLFIAAGTGYLLWTLLAPYFPSIEMQDSTASRRAEGDQLFKDGRWSKALLVYREMLVDDPDNGLALRKIANTVENQWRKTWHDFGKSNEASNQPNNSGPDPVLENKQFEISVNSWKRLLDNARYRRTAYERLARVHAFRFGQVGDDEDQEKAIGFLTEMLDKRMTTKDPIYRIPDFRFLRKHPSYRELISKQQSISPSFFGADYPVAPPNL